MIVFIFIVIFLCFGWCILRTSSGISCQTQEPTRNFKLGIDYTNAVNNNQVQVLNYRKYFLLFLPVIYLYLNYLPV